MKKSFGSTLKISLAIMLSLFTSNFMPVMTAYATKPKDEIVVEPVLDNCKDLVTLSANGWGAKIDTIGDPATVTVNADPGMLIDQYCVKAGSGVGAAYIQAVTPSATVVIDHNVKSSVSHYVVHQIPAPATPVSVIPAVFTPPTCDAIGTLIGVNTSQYTFARTGPDTAAVLTATAVGNVTLTGTTVFGPFDLTQLSEDECEEPLIPVAGGVIFSDVCGTSNDTFTLDIKAGVSYSVNGNPVTTAGPHSATGAVTVIASAQTGYTLTGHAYFENTFTNVACEVVPHGVTAGVVTVSDVCGTQNDKLIIPSTPNVTYKIGDNVVVAGEHTGSGSVTVVAYADAGYKLNHPYSFTYTFTNEACNETPEDSDKVTLCHATESESNPYNRITVDASGAFNGHLGDGDEDHQNGEDIIPPFTYQGETYSQNWDAKGMLIYNSEECDEEPVTVFIPVVAVVTLPCVAPGTTNGQITVKVTNPNDFGIDFQLQLKNSASVVVQTKDLTVGADSNQTVTLTGLAAGDYDLELWASDGELLHFVTTTDITLADCVVLTPGRGGDVLGDNVVKPVVTAQTATPQVLGTSLPASLPATGAEANINMFYAVLATIATYGAVYFLQGRRQLQN